MGIVSKAGDWAFKAFTAGLGITTIYLTATFSANVYKGLAWHNAQSCGPHQPLPIVVNPSHVYEAGSDEWEL
ncbi:unnamed protein product [Prunus armeniaca]|uniref:Uncharacterized protein n=1 Tax=Prunus armeniaca TaxID=36596 RepID=A0A6J5XEC4_PRUAR|nr:unnamed protein product [Prunus armeniaca]